MIEKRSLVPVVLAASLAAAAAATPEFDVAKEDERAKLAAIEKDAAAGDDGAVYAMDELLARLARATPLRDARNAPGDMLLEDALAPGSVGLTMRSHRTLAFETAKRLPAATRKKLADAQREALATERKRGADDDALLLRRFPFAPDAAAMAWRLAERAFDDGDDTAALSWDRLAARVAALQVEPPRTPFAAHARRASVLLRTGDLDAAEALLRRVEGAPDAAPKLLELLRDRIRRQRLRRDAADLSRRPPEGQIPDLFASYQLNKADPASTTPNVLAPPVAASAGDLALVSDGSRFVAVDARTGELRGRLPLNEESGSKVSPPGTGLPGYVATHGDLVALPLFYEKLLARSGAADGRAARSDPDSDEPSVRGGYFSLFAYDARSLRMLWWDGDAGTSVAAPDESQHGRPPGTDALDDRSWKFYTSKHVIGRPALDGKRIYLPLVSALAESTLWIAAFERRTGEGGTLVLVPSWRTFISVSAQPAALQGQGQPVPTLNPRLALDAEGRLFVQTDQGVLAALDVRTGGIDWVHRTSDEDATRAARARQSGAGYRPTSDPPVAFAGDGSRPSVVVAAWPEDERWVGLDAETGALAWRSDTWTQPRTGGFTPGRNEGPRVLALTPSIALGYGGSSFVAFDAFTGAVLVEPNKVRAVHLEDQERLAGAAVAAGSNLLLLPTESGRARKLQFREETVRGGRRIELALGEDLPLQGVPPRAPFHLMVLAGRLVATTPARVNVYTWVPRSE